MPEVRSEVVYRVSITSRRNSAREIVLDEALSLEAARSSAQRFRPFTKSDIHIEQATSLVRRIETLTDAATEAV